MRARHAIFAAGYDRAYGARPLKRAIQRMVQDKLAVRILEGTVLHGDRVVIDAGAGGGAWLSGGGAGGGVGGRWGGAKAFAR